ncbi:hypothetical protein GC207_10410 [bacterium]|nr:hypothetical protein [bacterium]
MDFEAIKVIWDSQNEKPLYALNETGLHAVLREKSRRFGRLMFRQELETYGASLFVITVILFILVADYLGLVAKVSPAVALTKWDVVALLVAIVCWAQYAILIYSGRKRQHQRERKFTSSLRDDLERDIEQTRYQIAARKNIVRGFIPPHIGSGLVSLVIFRAMSQEWMIIPLMTAMVVALAIETRSQRRLVKREMLPRLQALESLRDKLAKSES